MSHSRFLYSAFPAVFMLALHFDRAIAQQAHDNVVTDASDAFGSTIGREEIGLYSAGNARGFSPSEAGNLRIDGLYFDQIARLGNQLVRSSSIHVGISAQGFLFPAPTGVVDFHLRTPSHVAGGTIRAGYETYADQAWLEFNYQSPVVNDVFAIGAGVGLSRNSSYNIADSSDDKSIALLALWEPTETLVIKPFWSRARHEEYGETQHVFIGDAGVPEFRGVDLMPQSWADYAFTATNFGGTANYSGYGDWILDAGLFHSRSEYDYNFDPLLLDTSGMGVGNYLISAVPPRDLHSTSGELRLSRTFQAAESRHTVFFSVKGRVRDTESGGEDTVSVGPGTTSSVPQISMPAFGVGDTTLVEATQLTPGIAYQGQWLDHGQLTLGLQRTFYERTVSIPAQPAAMATSDPWLYNIGGAYFLSSETALYASYTRGFEEIGNAPLNAVNRGEAAPAQLTEQVEAGIRHQLLPNLQLVAGVFEISKPYFDLDEASVFRRVGSIRNRGIEVSLAGDIGERITLVAGATLTDAEVGYDTGASGATSEEAVGPVPRLIRINFQYHTQRIAGLTYDVRIESMSSRYARYDSVQLPAVTTVDIGARYDIRLFGKNASLRAQVANITDEYGLTPTPSGKVTPFDGRSLEVTVAVDL